ncbi:MAG: DUF3500 domain-containing protein [Chitinophagaceae bacterium]
MNRFILLISFLGLTGMGSFAQKSEMATVANQFINSLDKNQKLKALFPFVSEERYNFHFVPRDDRKGISVNELTPSQKEAAMTLMKFCLSSDAYRKATEIMQLEIILKGIENRPDTNHFRDPGKYFFSIFGIPGNTTTWGWRVEGHHVSLNFSAKNNSLVSGTPGFFGSNPAVVPAGPQKGKEILKDETEKGFTLLHSFSGEQLKKVIFDTTAPGDIFTFDKRKAMIEHPGGIGYSEMNGGQQQNLLRLIELYVHRYTKLFADDLMKEIQDAGLENLKFSWAGARQPGIGNLHYYRVQGPTLIIEYDNTQNNGNHVHSVIRDLKHDFGGDELLEHYLKTNKAER